MDIVKGVVETVYGAGREAKIKVGGVYYSNKFQDLPAGVERGSEVEVHYNNNPAYKGQFWKKVNVLSSSGTVPSTGSSGGAAPRAAAPIFPVPYNSQGRSICRQNALTNAVNVLTTGAKAAPKVEEVIALAMKFESYTTGDVDKEAMKDAEESFDPES